MMKTFLAQSDDGTILSVMVSKCETRINGYPWRQFPKEYRDKVEAKAKELKIEIHY